MLIYIVCRDILFIHFPASTHKVIVVTGTPLMMVIAPFIQMEKLLPDHPVTSTFDHLGLYNLLNGLKDMIPGPSPPISTAPEPPASASYHPYCRYIHWSSASHSNAVTVRSPNPAGNCHFKCKSPSMWVESCGRTPQQVVKYSITNPFACAYLTKLCVGSAILKTPLSIAICSISSRSRPLEWAQPVHEVYNKKGTHYENICSVFSLYLWQHGH